jgi:hypothetical protein
MNHIKIELNKKEHAVELNGNANEFMRLAPFETSLSEYAGSHYWGSIPAKLFTADELRTSKPRKVSMYYADHLTAIAIYFDDPGSIAPYVVYHLGVVMDDLSDLRTAGPLLRLKVG